MRKGAENEDLSNGLTRETFGGQSFYSGRFDPDKYATVCLEVEEGELAEIRGKYRNYKKIEDLKASSQETEKETKSKGPKKEESIFDLIRLVIGGLVPIDKVVRTAKALEKLVDPSKIRSERVNQLITLVANFCDGSNPFDFEFNEGKWRIWIKSNS